MHPDRTSTLEVLTSPPPKYQYCTLTSQEHHSNPLPCHGQVTESIPLSQQESCSLAGKRVPGL